MATSTNVWEMDSRLLVLEYRRLVELEAEGKKDELVGYNSYDLEVHIMNRLREYEILTE